jgi:hypothetical protein
MLASKKFTNALSVGKSERFTNALSVGKSERFTNAHVCWHATDLLTYWSVGKWSIY